MIIKFKQWNCILKYGTYPNGRVALMLDEAYGYESIAVATVNIPDVFLEPNQVIIKDYSENEGIANVLIDNDIIGPPLSKILSGFVTVNIHELLI